MSFFKQVQFNVLSDYAECFKINLVMWCFCFRKLKFASQHYLKKVTLRAW